MAAAYGNSKCVPKQNMVTLKTVVQNPRKRNVCIFCGDINLSRLNYNVLLSFTFEFMSFVVPLTEDLP